MTTHVAPAATTQSREAASWMPMAIIMLAQIQMAFNVNALPVSIGGIAEDLDTPATSVGTALVMYSLFVAAFVMAGAKIGKIVGERLVFQVTVVAHGLAMALMAVSPSVSVMNSAQTIAGLAAAGLVPSLVVLIAANYRGAQQAQALGLLASTSPMAGVLAFLVAGYLGTALSWRYSFGLVAGLAAVVFLLSFWLKPIARQPGIRIDTVGATLAALAIILISFGFNSLNTWGLLLARGAAPFDILGLSPAPLMIVVGIIVGQGFFAWSHQRAQLQKSSLLSLEVLDSREERNATFAMLIIGALGPAVNFLIPLYIQIVQGRSSLQTSVAVVPYALAIAASAIFIVRLYDVLTPRRIGFLGFITVAVGLALLAFTVDNDWGTPVVIASLVILGLGEGALLTLLFNVLVTASPKHLAGDVGALRGTANNLSTAVGTAMASLLSIGLLTLIVTFRLAGSDTLTPDLQAQVALDEIDFVSNDQLAEVLSTTTATPEQVDEAVRLNTGARLRALRETFIVLAAIALLAIIPSLGLPNYVPGDVPVQPPEAAAKLREAATAV